METIVEIKRLVRQVEGWLEDREGKLLYNLAKKCSGKGVIVEIGSWKGKSTIWLAKGSKAGKRIPVYAIDPHTGSSEHVALGEKVWTFDEFQQNIHAANVADIVVPVVTTSEVAAKKFNQPVELIFIDGAHEYNLVKLDFDVWFPKVVEGGFMVFHDSTGGYPGPKRVVNEKIYRSWRFRNIGFIESITFAEKVKKTTIKGYLRNHYLLCLKYIYEATSKVIANNKFFFPRIFIDSWKQFLYTVQFSSLKQS